MQSCNQRCRELAALLRVGDNEKDTATRNGRSPQWRDECRKGPATRRARQVQRATFPGGLSTGAVAATTKRHAGRRCDTLCQFDRVARPCGPQHTTRSDAEAVIFRKDRAGGRIGVFDASLRVHQNNAGRDQVESFRCCTQTGLERTEMERDFDRPVEIPEAVPKDLLLGFFKADLAKHTDRGKTVGVLHKRGSEAVPKTLWPQEVAVPRDPRSRPGRESRTVATATLQAASPEGASCTRSHPAHPVRPRTPRTWPDRTAPLQAASIRWPKW